MYTEAQLDDPNRHPFDRAGDCSNYGDHEPWDSCYACGQTEAAHRENTERSIHDEEVNRLRERSQAPQVDLPVSPWVRRALANELPSKELSPEAPL